MPEGNGLLSGISRFKAGIRGRLPSFDTTANNLRLAKEQERGLKDQARAEAAAIDSVVVLDHLNNGRIDRVKQTLSSRLESLVQENRDPSHTLAIAELIESGDIEKAKEELGIFARRAQLEGALPQDDELINEILGTIGAGDETVKAFQPITLVNPNTREKMLVSPTVSKSGRPKLAEFDIPDGFEISKETAEEKRAADQLAKRDTKADERNFQFVDVGQEAADSTSTLRRSIDLLDEIETGGFESVALKASQLFGIESADEAELSTMLARSVLKQLKPTFGAQFTKEEFRALERIEARIGKSTPGNMRVLKQTLKIAERAANRGIESAVALRDFASAQRIQEALDFILESPGEATVEGLTTGQLGNMSIPELEEALRKARGNR